jgi:hypothetical protein
MFAELLATIKEPTFIGQLAKVLHGSDNVFVDTGDDQAFIIDQLRLKFDELDSNLQRQLLEISRKMDSSKVEFDRTRVTLATLETHASLLEEKMLQLDEAMSTIEQTLTTNGLLRRC